MKRAFLILALIFTGCQYPYEEKGGISATIILPPEVKGYISPLSIFYKKKTTALERERVQKIVARVLKENVEVKSAEFSPNVSEGEIEGVPAGENYTLIVEGVDSSGEALYRGEKEGITVKMNEITDAGEIYLEPVKPLPPLVTEYPAFITSPQNIVIKGKKEAFTSLYLNERKVLEWSENRDWEINVQINVTDLVNITPGTKFKFELKTANSKGVFSEPTTLQITFDNLPPDVRPYNFDRGTVFTSNPQQLLFLIFDAVSVIEVKGAIVKIVKGDAQGELISWDGSNFSPGIYYFDLYNIYENMWSFDLSEVLFSPGDYDIWVYAKDEALNWVILTFPITISGGGGIVPSLRVTGIWKGSGKIMIDWDDFPGATGYKIYYGNSPGGPYNGRGILEGPSPIYTGSIPSQITLHFTEISAGIYFRISPVDSYGAEGPPSEEYFAVSFIPDHVHTFYPPLITSGALFGYSMEILPDLDGDSFDEMVISAPGVEPHGGCVFLIHGGSKSIADAFCSGQSGAFLGSDITYGYYNPSLSLVVGAPMYDGSGKIDSGAIFIFSIDASTSISKKEIPWKNMKLRLEKIVEGSASGDYFGTSVERVNDINGNYMDEFAVGATGCDGYYYIDTGAVYLYTDFNFFTPYHVFTQDLSGNSLFGKSLLFEYLNNDYTPYLVIGAPGDNPSEATGGGAVYVYSLADYSLSAFIYGNPYEKMGYSLDALFDINSNGYRELVVGLPGYGGGRVDIFEVFPGINYLFSIFSPFPDAQFGTSLGVSADYDFDGAHEVLIGMPFYKCNGIDPSGGAMLFSLDPVLGPYPMYLFCLEGNGSGWGSSVIVSADMDRDGRLEFLLGGPHAPESSTGPGGIGVFTGGELRVFPYSYDVYAGYPFLITGFGGNPPYDFTLIINHTGSSLGYPSSNTKYTFYSPVSFTVGMDTVSVKDKALTELYSYLNVYYFDPITFASYESSSTGVTYLASLDFVKELTSGWVIVGEPNANMDQGKVEIFDLSGNLQTSISSPYPVSGGYFGYSVLILDDMNNDGVSEFAVSIPGENVGMFPRAGSIYIFDGSDKTQLYGFYKPVSDSYFGSKMFLLDDMNKDGYRDIAVVSTPGNISLPHLVEIYTITSSSYSLLVALPDTNIGDEIKVFPDIDSDGVGEIMVSSSSLNKVLLYSSLNLSYAFSVLDGPPSTNFGKSFTLLKDLNGDGIPELAVGAPASPEGGSVHFYLSSSPPNIYTNPPLFTLNAPSGTGSSFGSQVINIGDINRDGFDEIAVGAPGERGGGAVYIVPLRSIFSSKMQAEVWKVIPPQGAQNFGESLLFLSSKDSQLPPGFFAVTGDPIFKIFRVEKKYNY